MPEQSPLQENKKPTSYIIGAKVPQKISRGGSATVKIQAEDPGFESL